MHNTNIEKNSSWFMKNLQFKIISNIKLNKTIKLQTEKENEG